MKTLLILAVCFIAAQTVNDYQIKKIKTENLLTDQTVKQETLTDEQREKLKKYRSQCLALNTKVDVKLVNELKSGYFKTENEPLKKYILCILVKAGVMTKAGEFKKDVLLAKTLNPAEKPIVKKLLDKCLVFKGNTPHQSAWNYSKCFHEHRPKRNETIFQ